MVSITGKEFQLLSEYIELNYGIQLKDQKQTLMISRLHKVLEEMGFQNFTQYYEYIIRDKSGEAVTTLVDKITTNHTYFMREAEHFYYFKNHVLPEIVPKIKSKDLRIWCAASSSGEEPYTLAMIIDEFFGHHREQWDTKLLATDISTLVLEIAKKGIYSNERIAPLEKIWKSQYFRKLDNDHSIVVDQIRNQVIYRKFNLMEPEFPFKKKFHVIFCRNVMIYFDTMTKDQLVSKFYDCLEEGGYLFVGHSETINRGATKLMYMKPAVYKK